MPLILMVVGAVLVLVGIGSIAAGAPDWVLGFSLGATLIQSGTIALVGGIVLIALGMVLNALQDLSRKLDALPSAAMRPAPIAPAAAPEPQQQPQRQPADDPMHRLREASQTGAEEIARPRREAPGPAGEQPARTRREPPSAFPSDDQMRIRREPPPAYGEESPRPRREVPPLPMEEPPARPHRERPMDQSDDDLARARGDYVPMRRREEAARPTRESSSLPPLPQVPSSNERRRARSTGEEQSDPYTPRFRPVETGPGAQVRNPASETVVRSGVIGGMAYTLYADGSIEAELAIGTVRFGSIAELQDHVNRTGTEADVDFKEQSR